TRIGRLYYPLTKFVASPGISWRGATKFRAQGLTLPHCHPYLHPYLLVAYVITPLLAQGGNQRDALPRAVAELLGFDRLRSGGTEIVGTVVDILVERGTLRISGPHVYVE